MKKIRTILKSKKKLKEGPCKKKNNNINNPKKSAKRL